MFSSAAISTGYVYAGLRGKKSDWLYFAKNVKGKTTPARSGKSEVNFSEKHSRCSYIGNDMFQYRIVRKLLSKLPTTR